MTWDIDPAIFRLGFYEFRYYSVLFGLGFLCGYFFFAKVLEREGKPVELVENGIIYMIAGTLIGARLGHVLFYNPHWLWENPLQVFKVWEGGLASHGAAIGIFTALYLFCRKEKLDYLWLLDRVAVPTALGGVFIRLGNFFNSEILGKATDWPTAIVFKRIDDVARHPAQLYESAGYLVIFAILFSIYKKIGAKTPRGLLVGLFLILVFCWRFTVEFVKERHSDFEMGLPLSMGQILSIIPVVAGIALVAYSLKKGRVA
jgi:prolipoprotein diacylglyceryl transferase